MDTITDVIKRLKVGSYHSKLIAIDGDVYVVQLMVRRIIKKDILMDGHTNPARNPEVMDKDYVCDRCGLDKLTKDGKRICAVCD